MPFRGEEENFHEFKITSYSSEEGLDYMTIKHVQSGICLGSAPIIREDINQFHHSIQKRIIREDTKNKLIEEMKNFAKDLIP